MQRFRDVTSCNIVNFVIPCDQSASVSSGTYDGFKRKVLWEKSVIIGGFFSRDKSREGTTVPIILRSFRANLVVEQKWRMLRVASYMNILYHSVVVFNLFLEKYCNKYCTAAIILSTC